MGDTLVDFIYEAAFLPDRWAGVFDLLAEATGSSSGSILIYPSVGMPRGRTNAHVQPTLDEYFASGAWKVSPRQPSHPALLAPRFFGAHDLLSPEDLERDPITLAQNAIGIGWQIASSVYMPMGDLLTFTFERVLTDGPHPAADLARLDALLPHLARTGLVGSRLGLERACAAVETLDFIGLPAAVMAPSGSVVASNAGLDLCPGIVAAAHGRLALAAPAADRLLRQALERFALRDAPLVQSIPLRAESGAAPGIAHLVPFRRAARDLYAGGDILLVVTTLGQAGGTDSTLLAGLFDLTPAEARVATAIASGESLAETATRFGVSVATVRTQLKGVFGKTGTSRQAELVGLLARFHPTMVKGG